MSYRAFAGRGDIYLDVHVVDSINYVYEPGVLESRPVVGVLSEQLMLPAPHIENAAQFFRRMDGYCKGADMDTTRQPAKALGSGSEDIRFAVVMNGGVSLAVWIGGVTHEINEMARANCEDPWSVYGELLSLLRATARVDVIAGTSAGGLNGAFLALAQAYDCPLSQLGELWAEKASFTHMMRSPVESDPPSLLRGDEYFLPELANAFEEIAPVSERLARYQRPDVRPLHLIMTTTLMRGQSRPIVDDYGTEIHEVSHTGFLHFRRSERMSETEDPFRQADITRRLALASRSTASFPYAFEPSHVPVGEPGRDELHPDMNGGGMQIADFANSQFVLDGGVLLNKPIGPALEAIQRQAADRQVRRLLLYINPCPDETRDLPSATAHDPPTLRHVAINSLLRLPQAQTVHEELAAIAQHNDQARTQRFLRWVTARRFDGDMANKLLKDYWEIRLRRAALVAYQALDSVTPPSSRGKLPWTPDNLCEALRTYFKASPSNYLMPDQLPPSDDLGWTSDWKWGLRPVRRMGEVARDVLKRGIWLLPLECDKERTALQHARQSLYEALAEVRGYADPGADAEHAFWRRWAPKLPPPSPGVSQQGQLVAWVTQAMTYFPAGPDVPQPIAEKRRERLRADFGRLACQIASTLEETRDPLWKAVDLSQANNNKTRVPDAKREGIELKSLLQALVPKGQNNHNVANVLRRMLVLEVCELSLLGSQPQAQQEVILRQVSAHISNSFNGPEQARKKLTGVQLWNFGAFYKPSWRANDWIWGRLDGVTHLVTVLLSPARLRQIGYTSEDAYEQIRRIALNGPHRDELEQLLTEKEDKELRDELAFLERTPLGDKNYEWPPLPPSLPHATRIVARRLQAEVLAMELPRMAAILEKDPDATARERDTANRWREAANTYKAKNLFEAFHKSDIAAEKPEHDPRRLGRLANQVLFVATATLGSTQSGLGPARLAGWGLRFAMIPRYVLVNKFLSSPTGGSALNLVRSGIQHPARYAAGTRNAFARVTRRVFARLLR